MSKSNDQQFLQRNELLREVHEALDRLELCVSKLTDFSSQSALTDLILQLRAEFTKAFVPPESTTQERADLSTHTN